MNPKIAFTMQYLYDNSERLEPRDVRRILLEIACEMTENYEHILYMLEAKALQGEDLSVVEYPGTIVTDMLDVMKLEIYESRAMMEKLRKMLA